MISWVTQYLLIFTWNLRVKTIRCCKSLPESQVLWSTWAGKWVAKHVSGLWEIVKDKTEIIKAQLNYAVLWPLGSQLFSRPTIILIRKFKTQSSGSTTLHYSGHVVTGSPVFVQVEERAALQSGWLEALPRAQVGCWRRNKSRKRLVCSGAISSPLQREEWPVGSPRWWVISGPESTQCWRLSPPHLLQRDLVLARDQFPFLSSPEKLPTTQCLCTQLRTTQTKYVFC